MAHEKTEKEAVADSNREKERRHRRSRSRSRGRDSKSRRSRGSRRRDDRHHRRSYSRSRSHSKSRHRSHRHRRHHSRSRTHSRSRSPSLSHKKSKSPIRPKITPPTIIPNAETLQKLIANQMAVANPQLTRQARRVYVGNLPVSMGLNEHQLTQYFNALLPPLGITTPHPVLSCWVSSDGTFCFVEFRRVSDSDLALKLLEGTCLGGRMLRIGRPADYAPPPDHLKEFEVPIPPAVLAAAKAQEAAGNNPAALQQMNLLGLAGLINPLTSIVNPLGTAGMTVAPANPEVSIPSGACDSATKVLLLCNMVTGSDLKDDDEYEDIQLDVLEECERFGPVERVVIPRTGLGMGRIFTLFTDPESTTKAQTALNGRSFNAKKVEAYFYDVDKFEKEEYE